MPSLAQLDEAVRAYLEEDPTPRSSWSSTPPSSTAIAAERADRFEEAELAGEIVSPPAAPSGVATPSSWIAERTSAMVLSNDSFQEFHGEHPGSSRRAA